jgi:hypothetical protein
MLRLRSADCNAGQGMILVFMLACLAAVWWIFRSGCRLKT